MQEAAKRASSLEEADVYQQIVSWMEAGVTFPQMKVALAEIAFAEFDLREEEEGKEEESNQEATSKAKRQRGVQQEASQPVANLTATRRTKIWTDAVGGRI